MARSLQVCKQNKAYVTKCIVSHGSDQGPIGKLLYLKCCSNFLRQLGDDIAIVLVYHL